MDYKILYYTIGLCHFLGISAIATYSTLFRKSKYDMYVLLSIFAIIILWTIHNGECFITQYVKQFTYETPSGVSTGILQYTQEPEDDMLFIFDGNRDSLSIFSTLIIIMYLVSIWQLLLRNNYSIYSCVGLSVVYIAYLAAYKLHKTRSSKHSFNIINKITGITYLTFGLYVFYRLWML